MTDGGAVALAGGGALTGMNIGATFGEVTGAISTGSPNVTVNSKPAARTLADTALCDEHDGPQQIATGSRTVFINSMPASRLGDHTVCDARISSASTNVVIGGGTYAYAVIDPEVSPVAVTIATDMLVAGTVVGLGAGAAAAFMAGGAAGAGIFGLQAAGGLAGGIAGGMAGGAIGQAIDPAHGTGP